MGPGLGIDVIGSQSLVSPLELGDVIDIPNSWVSGVIDVPFMAITSPN